MLFFSVPEFNFIFTRFFNLSIGFIALVLYVDLFSSLFVHILVSDSVLSLSLMLRPTVSRPVCLGISTHLGLTTRSLLLSDCCGLVDVGRSVWREDGSVLSNCCWSSQRSHSRVRVPWDSRPYFTVSDSTLPFSSPPTTRRVTVEVFDPAYTRDIPF
jgi:hypothetical protein